MDTLSLVDLTERFGSPLYVYQLETVRSAIADLRSWLPRPSTLYFSLKANPHPALGAVLHESGCHAEVSSEGELMSALAAGFLPSTCLYTGPGKSPAEIKSALTSGVRRFSVESSEEMKLLGAVAVDQGVCAEVLLRVNGNPAGKSGLRMSGVATQFGFDEDQLLATVEQLASVEGTRVVGTHQYSISGALDEDSLVESLRGCISLASRLAEVSEIPLGVVDIGGGFASPYGRPGVRPEYARLATSLTETLDVELPQWRTGGTELCFESGRFLTGESGSLVATVRSVKVSRGRTFVVLDAGINHLGGLTGLGRFARPSATPIIERRDGLPMGSATLVGPLCTPADVLNQAVELHHVEQGQHLVFPNVGAYGLTASLIGFLSRPAPVEIVIDGETLVAASQLSVARQSVRDTGVS